ncbi:MAG TPA: uracil-DNA glycosylase, partial [Rubrivivax sp.]|nr:uracil-DNA glycosylase [Rubrivivax sp.]
FQPGCIRCPRLAAFLESVRQRHPGYHARPVPSFGDPAARLLVVGLAPGMHGANRTGRPFTGDHAGILLYRTLFEQGFASAADSAGEGDGLRLLDCRITNAVRCLPPANKPTPAEVRECNPFLAWELARVPAGGAVLALGAVAHAAVLRAQGLKASSARFAHGARHALPGARLLVDSYHCSRYNTQTRRLTPAMFASAMTVAREWIHR